jgi:hypothetical protein
MGSGWTIMAALLFSFQKRHFILGKIYTFSYLALIEIIITELCCSIMMIDEHVYLLDNQVLATMQLSIINSIKIGVLSCTMIKEQQPE